MTDNLRDDLTRDLNALRAAASRGPVTSREIFQMTDGMMDRLSRAALADAPQPAPVDREALVEVIRKAFKGHGWLPADLPDDTADALLACGLRLPTDAQPETLAWAIVEADGYIDTDLIYDNFDDVRGCAPGETVKRVSVRVVDDEADAGKGEAG